MRHLVIDARTVRPGATGVGHFVAGLLHGLDTAAESRGWRVTALRLAPKIAGQSAWAESIWQGLRTISIHDVPADYEDHPRGDLWLQFQIGPLMRRLGGDLLVSPAFVGPVGPRSFARLLVVLDTIAWEFPGNYPLKFQWYLRTMTRWSARYADRIVSISPFAASRIARLGLGGGKRIGVVPCGLDATIFHPSRERQPAERPLLVYAASLEPRKNHEVLFRALRESPLRELKPELVLLARTSASQELFLRRAAAGISVRRVEPADARDVAAWMQAADVALFPSKFEGFGLPVIEAMACGTPLVASGIPTNRWLTAEGRAAQLVPPADERAWAAAIADALKMGTETKKRAASGLRRAAAFTWQHSAERLLAEAEAALRPLAAPARSHDQHSKPTAPPQAREHSKEPPIDPAEDSLEQSRKPRVGERELESAREEPEEMHGNELRRSPTPEPSAQDSKLGRAEVRCDLAPDARSQQPPVEIHERIAAHRFDESRPSAG